MAEYNINYLLKICLVLASLFILSLASAQDAQQLDQDTSVYYPKVQMFEFGIDISDPLGDYQSKNDGTDFGISGRYVLQWKPDSPAFLGFEISYHQMKSVSGIYGSNIDGFIIDVEEKSKSHLIGLNLLFRYYPSVNIPVIEPYLEGIAGLNWLYSTRSVSDFETGDNFDFSLDNSNLGLNYGIVGGFQINLHNYMWYLNTRVSYLFGTSASFQMTDPIDSTNLLDLEIKNASITHLRYHLGVTFAL